MRFRIAVMLALSFVCGCGTSTSNGFFQNGQFGSPPSTPQAGAAVSGALRATSDALSSNNGTVPKLEFLDPRDFYAHHGFVRSAPIPPSLMRESRGTPGGVTPDSLIGSVDKGAGGGLHQLPVPGAGYLFLDGMVAERFVEPSAVNVGAKSNLLYAPTTHWPDQCFEIGSRYQGNGGGASNGYLYVYDFCAGAQDPGEYVAMIPFDNFKQLYTTKDAQTGNYYYQVYVAYDYQGYDHPYITENTSNGLQAMEILGPYGQTLEESSTITPSRTDGWSFSETHYNAVGQPCPAAHEFGAFGISYEEQSSSTIWASPTDLSGSLFHYGQCFEQSAGSPGYFYTPQSRPAAGWDVRPSLSSP